MRTCRALALLVLLFPALANAKPAPGVSGTLSIIPGLGQVANGDTFEGIGWFVTVVGLVASKNDLAKEFGTNLWMYNTYDAYRDAGAKRTTKYTLLENYVANFNPLNIVDPIGAPLVGVAALGPGKTKSNKGTPSSAVERIFYYSSVGLGEEGLFRGFLFPGFSDLTGSTFAGAVISSAIFSAAHGAGGSAFVVRFVGGMLFCWQLHMNKYDMRKGIFAHTWFDFFLTRNGGTESDINWNAVVKQEWRF